MTTQEYNEHLFDAMMRAAFCESMEKELAAIDWNPTPEHVFSSAHEKRIKAILGRHRRREWAGRAAPVFRRAAAIVLIVLSVAFAGLMTVEIDLRESGMVLPAYIPEGFELVVMDQSQVSVFTIYENDAGNWFFYEQMVLEDGNIVSVDNEQHDLRIIRINGREASLSASNTEGVDSVVLIFSDENYRYMISGELSENETILVAESVLHKKYEIFVTDRYA